MKTLRRGLSSTELLVALGIVFLLLGLLLPAVAYIRESANRLSCQNNLRQIGIAINNYASSFGSIPSNERRFKAPLSWQVAILPQLGYENIYQSSLDAADVEKNIMKCPPHMGQSVIPLYVCSSDGRLFAPQRDPSGATLSLTSYIGIAGIAGSPGVFDADNPTFAQITDGLSNTIMVSERPPPNSAEAGTWYVGYLGFAQKNAITGKSYFNGPNGRMFLTSPPRAPALDNDCLLDGLSFGPGRLENRCDRYHLWSLHTRGGNFLFVDASVRFFPYSAYRLIEAFGSRSGGEIVEP